MNLKECGITLEAYLDKNSDIICVFGCLLTEAGKKIKQEMLEWILPKYDCYVVNQEAPGELFEYPALLMAKKISKMYNKPVLYLHTKGAANSKNIYDQNKCRMIWKDEFINHYNEYFAELKKDKKIAKVLCPFTGSEKSTILNGFIANVIAWKKVNIPEPIERYRYEHLFTSLKDVKMFGRIMNDVNILKRTNTFNKMLSYINNFNN